MTTSLGNKVLTLATLLFLSSLASADFKEKPLEEEPFVKQPLTSKIKLRDELPQLQPESMKGGKLVKAYFYKAELPDVLRTMAGWAQISLILSPNVSGQVNLRLNRVPVKEAIASLLHGHDLFYKWENTVLRVMTRKEYARFLRASYTKTRSFRTRYVRAQRAYRLIREYLTKDVGIAVYNARTQKIVVTDLPDRLTHIQTVLKEIDVPNKTIRVQLQVIEIEYSDDTDVGAFYKMVDMNTNKTVFNSRFKSSQSIITDTSGGLLIHAVIDDVGLPNGANPKSIELGLSALGIEGEMVTVSTPVLFLEENSLGTLLIGQEIPYPTSSSSNFGIVQEQFEFVQAGVKLLVRGRVENFAKKDERSTINLDMEIENSTADMIAFSNDNSKKAPQKNISRARLQLRCLDGQSVLIAGFTVFSRVEDVVGIPLLKEIPFVNFLFANKVSSYRKREVAIVLTPTVASPESQRIPARYEQIRNQAE